VISPTNQGGVVLIITALCMVFALVSILIRLHIRLQIRHAYERDDSAVAIAMVGIHGDNNLELELIVTSYSRSYNQALSLWRFLKAMEKQSQISRRAASSSCRRCVYLEDLNSSTWSHTFRRHMRVIYFTSSHSG
jgi:hypothetical protein